MGSKHDIYSETGELLVNKLKFRFNSSTDVKLTKWMTGNMCMQFHFIAIVFTLVNKPFVLAIVANRQAAIVIQSALKCLISLSK